MIERFWLFHYAYARLPRSAVVQGGGWEPVRFPFLGGLAVHRHHGPVLLDIPFGREGPSSVGMMMGAMLQRAGLTFDERWSVVPRLEELGFRAADVEHVLMTQLRYDHTGGMKTLAYATFHITEQEWAHATEGSDTRAATRGYVREDFSALDQQIVRHGDVPHLADHRRGLDVLGDGSVEMFHLPGPTPGHCGYRINFSDEEAVFFAGDTALTIPELKGGQQPGLIVRATTSSITGLNISRQALRRHLEEHPGDIPVVSHDLKLGERCIDDGPICYEPVAE